MNKLWNKDFGAGISFVVVLSFVVLVIQTHGTSSTGKISWGDVSFFLLLMFIFAGAIIDIVDYLRRK